MKFMRLAGMSLILAASCAAWSAPTEETLSRVDTWTFLDRQQKQLVQDGLGALKAENWLLALRTNEELLASAPESIFAVEPTLPMVAIRPAGSENLPQQKIVSGWTWRLECAHLALLTLDWDGAARRARLVSQKSAAHAPAANRLTARTLARQGKYVDAIRTAPKQKQNVVDDEAVVWSIAQIDSPENRMKLSDIAVGSQIGRGLPGVGQSTEKFPIGQRIEACLVLGDWWMRDGQSRMAISYYDRAAELAGRKSNAGLLAGALKKRAEG